MVIKLSLWVISKLDVLMALKRLVEMVLEVTKFGPGDFEILRMGGKGSFGKVFQNNHVDYMRAERDILTKVEHPFIVQLKYSFQGSLVKRSKLSRVTCRSVEAVTNACTKVGHLRTQLLFLHALLTSALGFDLGSEDQARIYAAEIVSAVPHLHQRESCRDLKPENILMDADGHVMLTDFGLAKIDRSSRSQIQCAEPRDTWLQRFTVKGHNKDADWWSVGILLYEMLTGQVVTTCTFSCSATEGPIQVGSGHRRDEIKSHKWFRTINWKKLDARELQPKFKPNVTGRDCTANFDKCWTAMPPDDSPASTPTASDHFQGYTYVAQILGSPLAD
ncbi:hypothetical protein HAX54_046876 [Datura stramonium]|uniref:Protein kinase domain-containing protein n=1 Tax=Datura stramonium TaxID=4076 RepID=A0ABS8SS90_DATST|nr:hypothetical protein [Datura stramonium]